MEKWKLSCRVWGVGLRIGLEDSRNLGLGIYGGYQGNIGGLFLKEYGYAFDFKKGLTWGVN